MSITTQGLVVLSAPDYSKPWLVSGSGRSGTTGLIRLIDGFGVPSLETDGIKETNENCDLLQFWQAGDLEAIRSFRKEWPPGTVAKIPGMGAAAGQDSELARSLDCNYVFSFRDPVAESFYAFQHPHANVGQLLAQRAAITRATIEAAISLSQSYGCLVVSYEKMIQPKSNWRLVQSLCTLMAGQPELLEMALRSLETEAVGYRNEFNEQVGT